MFELFILFGVYIKIWVMVKVWPADLELGLWKKYMLCLQSTKLKKEIQTKFKMISRTCLIFMIEFMVYDIRAYIDVRYGDTYPQKWLN